MPDNISSSTAKIQVSDSSGQRGWLDLGVHHYIKIAIIASLFYYLFRNEIETIVSRWLNDPSWSHGLLIPPFSLYFINQRKSEILNLNARPSYLGLFFLICGILFYPFNIVQLQYGYLKPIGMIATLGAVVLFLGGWKLIRYTWLPILYLVFAVPLPQRYYVRLTMPMQMLAAKVAGALLDLTGSIETTVNGVVIDIIYNGQRLGSGLNVAEACSGMRLLMAFLALGVAMAYLHHRSIPSRIILLASTIPIAIFCNMVRVTTTGFIHVFIGPEYAEGIYHDMFGFAMLPLAFGLYGFIAWFMANLFMEPEGAEAVEQDIIIRKDSN